MSDDFNGVEELRASLKKLMAMPKPVIRRALSRCGMIAVREAKANAPRSPTMKQKSATLKRKKRTRQRTMPGGLEKSIEYEITPRGQLSVFVAANSFAGKYAKRIHDEKGMTWRNRGPGTIAKGSRADEKFVERAIKDNTDKFTAIIKNEVMKGIKL